MGKIVTVDFRNDTLFAVERDDGFFVAVTPICETLGLDAKKQRERIQRDAILSEGGAIMALPSTGGMQETFCLRLDLVHGWLFTIDESRVKDEETRQRVLAYKRECYSVLFRHFHGRTQTEVLVGRSAFPEWPMDEMRTKRGIVDMYRMTYGAAASQWVAPRLGFPVPPMEIVEHGRQIIMAFMMEAA
jgi:hypothetical protein